MIVLLCLMVTLLAVNSAVQPASHSCPIDRREVSPRDGKRCTFLAVFGRDGRSSSAV